MPKCLAILAQQKDMNGDRPLEQPSSAQVRGGYGTLVALAPELRHIIYRQLIVKGHVRILGASQAINKEASEFIFKDGIFRMEFVTSGDSGLPSNLSQLLLENVQNVSIRVDNKIRNIFRSELYCLWPSVRRFVRRPRHLRITQQLELLRPFAGSGIYRKACCVIFEVCVESWKMVAEEMLEVLRSFVGFEEVVIEIRMRGDLDNSVYKFEVSHEADLRPPPGCHLCQEAAAVVRMYRGMNVVRNFLVPTLGQVTSTLVEKKTTAEVIMRQRYSPRKHLETVVVEDSVRFWADWCADSWLHGRTLPITETSR
ncbi:hypothetical protein N7G274_007410 [Stereocaulon virgatum]|uniref:Uncharacterized protein n=1 Tax=Stereocaulon virgatum TaxID=373712 RepID=A0ABR4A6J1_9LECA